jgi:hypothetical protein
MSRNRARLISISGVIGGLSGGGIDLITQPDDEKTAIAIPLAGSIIGLAIGALTTREYDATRGGGDGDAELDGSLVRWQDGRLAVDVPVPRPVALPITRAGRVAWETGARLTLLRARF